MENEVWKDVIDYEGIYQVSNTAKIRSIDRLCYVENHGKTRCSVTQKRKGRIIIPYRSKRTGYYMVVLSKNGVHKTKNIHRLMAVAHIPNPENKPQVNHKDGNKVNNKIENLEWVTHKENIIHAFENKLVKGSVGEGSHLSKLKKEDVLIIRDMLSKGVSMGVIARKYLVSRSSIFSIKHNESWKYAF